MKTPDAKSILLDGLDNAICHLPITNHGIDAGLRCSELINEARTAEATRVVEIVREIREIFQAFNISLE